MTTTQTTVDRGRIQELEQLLEENAATMALLRTGGGLDPNYHAKRHRLEEARREIEGMLRMLRAAAQAEDQATREGHEGNAVADLLSAATGLHDALERTGEEITEGVRLLVQGALMIQEAAQERKQVQRDFYHQHLDPVRTAWQERNPDAEPVEFEKSSGGQSLVEIVGDVDPYVVPEGLVEGYKAGDYFQWPRVLLQNIEAALKSVDHSSRAYMRR